MLQIETYMNNLNTELTSPDEIMEDDPAWLDGYSQIFVNKQNQILLGSIVDYYGTVEVCNLMTGDFGFFDMDKKKLDKQGTITVTDLMKDLNNYFLDELDYDNIIEHI